MNRLSQVAIAVATTAIFSAGSAQAQLPSQLQNWLQPLATCTSLRCIVQNIPTTPPPNWPQNIPWIGNNGPTPITTTPEPFTLALVGTGLVGVVAARRRRAQIS